MKKILMVESQESDRALNTLDTDSTVCYCYKKCICYTPKRYLIFQEDDQLGDSSKSNSLASHTGSHSSSNCSLAAGSDNYVYPHQISVRQSGSNMSRISPSVSR